MAVALVQEGAPLVPPEQVVPLYLREADAVSNFARAGPGPDVDPTCASRS